MKHKTSKGEAQENSFGIRLDQLIMKSRDI
jgi:hypothetical protein